ncbi:unnamed protein product [Closterium sp. NIES-65]|nr:unnamed protein product [Closterium sp. NIES-65]
MSTTTTSPLTPPSVNTVGSSQTLLTEAREYLPDVDHAVFKHFRIIKRVEGKAQQYECKFCSNVYTSAAIRCARKREADEALALAWAALHIPERHIDHPLMVNALNLVKRVGIDYVPPKRRYIGGAGLLSCRNGIEQGLVGIKASWKRTGVTVSSNMMTDRNGRPQANVLLVNDSGAVFTDCIDCNMERKTGEYVAGILRPVVEEVGPENVVAFCMDGGSHYAVAVKQLLQEWPHIQDVPCATHVLDLLMEDVGKMGWAKLTAEFFVALLKLPFKVMRQTDGHAVGMMGRLYNLMLHLTEDVGGLLDADEEQLSDRDKDKIRRILRDRWDGSLACAMHVAGRILNPANQEEDIFGADPECTKVFKAFISQQAEFLASRGDGGDDACDILLELGDGLRTFLNMKGSFGMPKAVAQRKLVKEVKYSMVKWWQWNGTNAPRVAGLVVRVLSQAVSASPCECGWSSWDAVHTARRNRLGSANCRDLVYVAHNWNVVRNWHTRVDVLPHVAPGIGAEPPIPTGYNGLEDETKGEDEEEGEDDIFEDEYAN